MSPGIILLFVLVAAFALTGILYLFLWVRDRLAREHLWFGVGSLMAAGAVAADCIYPYMGEPAIAIARRFSVLFCVGWLIAMTWFTVEYAASQAIARRFAMLLTFVWLVVLAGRLYFAETFGTLDFFDETRPLGVLNDVALIGLSGLVLAGTARLWKAKEKFRAIALGAGLGVALVQIASYGRPLDLEPSLPTPVPHAFLLMVLLMAYELARSVAAARSLSERQLKGLAHTSRLAIVGELTASIAHEINQPLGAILSNAEAGENLLERIDPPLDDIRQILQDIRRDGLRASNVIRQVRTLVRNHEFALEKLDANALTDDVIGLLAAEARRRRIRLEHSPTPAPAYIRGDRARLEQVLLNIVLNAMDAMDADTAADGATVGVSLVVLQLEQIDSGEVVIRVIDGGPGIPPDRLDQLFDSFYTSKVHGIGLGLSIARSIVEAHGGSICAANNVDAGATFSVTFPPFDSQAG